MKGELGFRKRKQERIRLRGHASDCRLKIADLPSKKRSSPAAVSCRSPKTRRPGRLVRASSARMVFWFGPNKLPGCCPAGWTRASAPTCFERGNIIARRSASLALGSGEFAVMTAVKDIDQQSEPEPDDET